MSPERPLSLPAKARLAAEVVASYVRVRRMVGGDIRDAVATLRDGAPLDRSTGRPPEAALAQSRRLARAVMLTLRLVPGDTRCLSQSLVLTRMLARRGIGSRLVIGVRPAERFAAHAWVEHGSVPLLPPGRSDFEELVTL
jgi:hypothetical protein